MACLMTHHLPGNVRELENMIERAIVLSEGSTLDVDNFSFENGIHSDSQEKNFPYDGFSLKSAKADLENQMIRKALTATDGNRTHAAKMLEISHPSLLSKMKLYGIE